MPIAVVASSSSFAAGQADGWISAQVSETGKVMKYTRNKSARVMPTKKGDDADTGFDRPVPKAR